MKSFKLYVVTEKCTSFSFKSVPPRYVAKVTKDMLLDDVAEESGFSSRNTFIILDAENLRLAGVASKR